MIFRFIIVVFILAVSACATTKYAKTSVTELSDAQLIEELQSVGREVGMGINVTSHLMAMRPEPAYVLASSTSFTTGNYSGNSVYTMPAGYSRNIYGTHTGSFSGVTNTNYQYSDLNANARAMNDLAVAVKRSQVKANLKRGEEVVAEIERRSSERQRETQVVIARFFETYPQMKSKQPLIAAILPWVSASNPDMSGHEKLEKAREISLAIPQDGSGITGSWFGVFSQQAVAADGEKYNLNSFFVIRVLEQGGKVYGEGELGSGEKIELYGERDGFNLNALIANKTAGINSVMQSTVAPAQITGNFTGSGAGLSLQGEFSMYR